MSQTEAKVILSVIDRITRPIKAIQDRIDRMLTPVRRVGRAIGDMSRAAGLPRLANSFANVGSRVAGVVGHVRDLVGQFTALSGISLAGVGIGLKKLWDTSATFESLDMQIGALFGEKRRKEVMDWAVAFAKINPGGVTDTIRALGMLKGYGVDGTLGTMQAISDYVAMIGGGSDDVRGISLAIGQMSAKQKVQAQEIIQLTNRSVPAWQLLSDATGKSVKDLQKMGEKGQLDISYVRKLVSQMQKVAKGAGAKALETGRGIIDRLGDIWEQFERKIGDSGAYAFAKKKVSEVTEFLARPEMDAIAKRISDAIVQVGTSVEKALKSVDWAKAWDGLQQGWDVVKAIGGALQKFCDLVGGPVKGALLILGAVTFGPLIASLASLTWAVVALGGAMMATGIGEFLLIVTGIGLAALAIYKYWEPIKAFFAGLWESVKTSVGDFLVWFGGGVLKMSRAGVAMVEAFGDGIRSAWGGVVAWLQGAWDKLTGWMPSWAKKGLGIGSMAPQGDQGGASGSWAPTPPSLPTIKPPSLTSPYGAQGSASGDWGGSFQAGGGVPVISTPAPDVTVNAPVDTTVIVNWSTLQETLAALNAKLAAIEARQRADIASALGD